MTLKIIGAGFGRTGTYSLKIALEELGFGKCYHMREVTGNPQVATTWLQASQGEPVDWDTLFTGYQATVDWPGCTFYQELMQKYPDAKVLLTTRDPERWYQSARQTIYEGTNSFESSILAKIIPPFGGMVKMVESLIWDGTFNGRFKDKTYAIQVFNDHIAKVKRVVPPEKRLVYEVKEGWGPLCEFLGVPIPADKPFPHLNDKAIFKKRIKMQKLAVWGGFGIIGLALGLMGLWAKKAIASRG